MDQNIGVSHSSLSAGSATLGSRDLIPEGSVSEGEEGNNERPKDLRFWLIILSLLVATFLSALDQTGEFHCRFYVFAHIYHYPQPLALRYRQLPKH